LLAARSFVSAGPVAGSSAIFVAGIYAPASAFAADRPISDGRDSVGDGSREGASDRGEDGARDRGEDGARGASVSTGAAVDSAAGATAAELFRDADLVLGAALIAEHDCEACHRRNVGGDGRSIYRPTGRIRTPGFLRGMVEYCNTQLNLQLFPEDVTSIAATLNRDHYRFK
jgi:hypothetical protein